MSPQRSYDQTEQRGESLRSRLTRAIGRPRKTTPKPETAPSDDPALRAVDAHRTAYAAYAPLADVQNSAIVGSPEYVAASTALDGPGQAEIAAFNAVIATRPTTTTGLRTLASYLPGAIAAVSSDDLDEDAAQALRTVCGGVLALVQDGQPLMAATTDWHSPPPGFMASPAIEPTSFASIEQGIRIEANRLFGIALAEQRRRQTMGAEGEGKPWDADDEARTRKALHLDALAAIACAGSIQVSGVRYVPESEHAHAEREGRVIAGGIEHGDGTISYCDAMGTLRRRPVQHWVDFIVMHLHAKVQSEIARRRILETGQMSRDEHAVWEADIRRRLRADAVFALAFRPERAFAAAEAVRNGLEPATAEERAEGEVELLALTPSWEAARDHYDRCIAEQIAVDNAAEGRPGPAPDGAGEDWQAWRAASEAWRERTGVAAAEDVSRDACRAVGEIEDRIANLPAASLAGLKLKARVGQRSDDFGLEWPEGLGEGLARDILAFAEPRPQPTGPDLVGLFDFGSASLRELLCLRELADLVGSTAYALASSGRGTKGYRSGSFTAVGHFMQELGDALTSVEASAEREARQRQPASPADRETRLAVYADAVIHNDDPDEITAFATELTAHAVALREGR